jgi:hypothetical protein
MEGVQIENEIEFPISVSLAVYSKRLPNIYMFAISQILPNPIQFAITTNSFSNIQFQPTNPFTNSLVYIPQIRFILPPQGSPLSQVSYLGTGVGAGGTFALSASSSLLIPAYFFKSASVKFDFFRRPSWPEIRP